MLMPDVNILVYAHRSKILGHGQYLDWFEKMTAGPAPFALSSLVAIGFIRVVTNSALTEGKPSPLPVVQAIIDNLIALPTCRVIEPGAGHLALTLDLIRKTDSRAKLAADAQHAAVAIAHGCTWVTRDSDFARFVPHGLTWQHLVFDRT